MSNYLPNTLWQHREAFFFFFKSLNWASSGVVRLKFEFIFVDFFNFSIFCGVLPKDHYVLSTIVSTIM